MRGRDTLSMVAAILEVQFLKRNRSFNIGRFAMKTLTLALLMTLLAGSAAAQVSSTTSGAPDVSVIKINWRRVEPSNAVLIEGRQGASPDYAARQAVNASRINEANSARESGGNPPPPKLLALPSIPDPIPPVRAWSGFVYEFTVKNTGAKIIREVVFEYSFTDPGTQRTVGRRQYKSKVKILPGMTAKVVVRSSLPPIGTINAAKAGQNPQEQSPDQMVIQTIKYADGSMWKRSSDSPPVQ